MSRGKLLSHQCRLVDRTSDSDQIFGMVVRELSWDGNAGHGVD